MPATAARHKRSPIALLAIPLFLALAISATAAFSQTGGGAGGGGAAGAGAAAGTPGAGAGAGTIGPGTTGTINRPGTTTIPRTGVDPDRSLTDPSLDTQTAPPPLSPPETSPRVTPDLPSSIPDGGGDRRLGPSGSLRQGQDVTSLDECMGLWDSSTHMTRDQWRAACVRTGSGAR